RAIVRLEAEAELEAGREDVTIEALKIQRGDSFFIASGDAEGDVEGLVFDTGEASLRSELKLDSMRDWAVKTFPKLGKIPKAKGRAFVDASIKREKGKRPKADFQIRADDLGIAKAHLGNLRASGNVVEDRLTMKTLTLESSAGAGSVTGFSMKLSEPTSFEAKVSVPSIQLHELLSNIGVGKIPVYVAVKGEAPCSGQFSPTLNITCKGNFHGDNLSVKDGMEKNAFVIAAIKTFDGEGQVTIDSNQVSYSTELSMPNSKGRSSGVVGFETGFQIDYEADKLSFIDVATLAQLKVEGAAKIKGSTQGDSDAATLSLKMEGTDVWFEDYWLGQPRGTILYKSGILGFEGIQGFHTVSRYNGDLSVDLNKKTIEADARIPFFDSKDLLKAFSRRVKLSFPVTGTGQAQIKVSGPLQFNRLSYDLKSSLFKGSVAGETFDQANFDVKSVKGEVRAEKVQMTKGAARISLTGTGHPDGNIDTKIQGRGLRVEDTSLVAAMGLSVSGLVDFDMDMTGYVLGPDTDMKGTLKKTSIGDQSVPDSAFQLKFGAKTIEGSGTLLGDVMKAELVIPLDPAAQFKLKLKTVDWNFAPLFAAIAGPQTRRDFEGLLTSEINLSSVTGGFWNSTGDISISDLSLSRGSLKLKAAKPIVATMREGQINVKSFEMGGDNVFIKVVTPANPTSKLDLQVNGKLDLSLVALLTPFFEDLRGFIAFSFNAKG
ncbi:MAG: hypothetical protein V4692_06980, partial [Bdellovibrionota bacterium]